MRQFLSREDIQSDERGDKYPGAAGPTECSRSADSGAQQAPWQSVHVPLTGDRRNVPPRFVVKPYEKTAKSQAGRQNFLPGSLCLSPDISACGPNRKSTTLYNTAALNTHLYLRRKPLHQKTAHWYPQQNRYKDPRNHCGCGSARH